MNHVLCHFEIPADDPERLTEFYGKLFGWTTNAVDMGDGEQYWLIQTAPEGENAVNGGLMKRQHPGQQPTNYIHVESVSEYADKAKQLGAKVLVDKQEVMGMGWLAVLQDPQGNVFALWEMAPK